MRALRRQRLRNWLHALGLLGGMAALTLGAGWLLGGPLLAALATGAVVFAFAAPGLANARLVLRLSGARPLAPGAAPDLQRSLRRLSERAGLPRPPVLCLAPGDAVNAFTVGDRRAPAVVLSAGLLHQLPEDEVVGVLAHEVAHIAHDDVRLMRLADAARRLATGASQVFLFLLLLNIPLLLLGVVRVPLAILVVLLGLPTLQGLLQLAFSRSREYAADFTAAELLGDPVPLARALRRLDAIERRPVWTIFGPIARGPEPEPWLRSHPLTADRIRRLEGYAGTVAWPHPPLLIPRANPRPRRQLRLGPFTLRLPW